jgi:Plasmid pRiA4b ORF-3-like protein
MTQTVHQLKVTLRRVKPPVWRRIVVPSEITLADLAPVLEAAMGWLGGHLHVFEADGARYDMPDPDWEEDDDLDERRFRLGDVLPDVGKKMRFDYDFGDGWEHDVVVEAIAALEPGVTYPLCLAGRRACPPEDCGGSWGYAELVEALADTRHPDHNDLKEWAPPGFDPARFDLEETNEALKSPPPLYDWR